MNCAVSAHWKKNEPVWDRVGTVMNCNECKNGYEYLEMLRQQNQKQTQSFNTFSRYLESRARKQGVPIHGQFELTPLCSLSCKMCYVHLTADQMRHRSLLTPEQWKLLIRHACEAGMLSASLTGGECLTYPGFEKLYLYLHSLGCQVDVMTNGLLLDEDRIQFFREHPPATIQITLYGGSEDAYERVTGHRVFHTIRENILRIKEAKLPLILSITPNRYLGEDVFDTVRTAWSMTGNVTINTSLFVPPGDPLRAGAIEDPEAEYYARILRFYKELRGNEVHEYEESSLPDPGGPCKSFGERGLTCGGGRSGFVINWKGEMLICNRMDARSFPLREGFKEAWRKIHKIAENWPQTAACLGCAYEDVCAACAAEKLKYAPSGEQPAELCRRTKYFASRGILDLPDYECRKG